ncbi:MAG: DUF362 domain-containing protein [Deltaproteobacteria bacterium]|nr:DUF362 domain-containing protein [Deltaproteobacteria bacterium]
MIKVVLAGVEKGSSEGLVRQAVRDAAEAATDFSWLSKGDSVFIKPALNSGNNYPATTSPVGIKSMVELLRDRGAGRIVLGDMSGIEHVKLRPDGFSGSTRSLMEKCGMSKVALEAGAELHFFEEFGWGAFYEDLPPGGSHWKKGLMLPIILREMDHIVLMPRCGRHTLAGSTLGLKAAVGYWRTDTRLEYHKDSETLYEKTAEGNAVDSLVTKQRLVVSVANKILTTFGPDRGYVVEPDTGLVIASQSVVAHDMVSLAWLAMGRLETPKWELVWFNDPDKSQFIVNMANRWIVSRLGNIIDAFQADTLIKNDVKTIWEDRTLNRAYQLFGGRPTIDIEAANDLISAEMKMRLTDMTTFGS